MIKRNIPARVRHLFWCSDMEFTRMGLAVGAILWAALLAWPGDLFAPSRATYVIMAKIAPEECWAAAFALQGVVMIYSLLWGYKSRLSFIADAFLGCVLWTTAVLACFLSHYHSSIATYQPPAAMAYDVVGMLSSWWCFVRYSTNDRKSV